MCKSIMTKSPSLSESEMMLFLDKTLNAAMCLFKKSLIICVNAGGLSD